MKDGLGLIVRLANVPDAMARLKASATPHGLSVASVKSPAWGNKFAKLTGDREMLKAAARGELLVGHDCAWDNGRALLLMRAPADKSTGSADAIVEAGMADAIRGMA